MKRRDVFESIEPPPGGLARLRAGLSPRRAPRWQPVLAGAFAVALVCGGVAFGLAGEQADLVAQLDASVFGSFDPEPVRLTGAQPGALQRLPSSTPQVVLYRVAMLDPSLEPPPE